MQVRKVVIIMGCAIPALELSGCASPWHKVGGTQAEFEQTLSTCQVEALRSVPPAIGYEQTQGSSYASSKCKGDRCSEYSSYMPPSTVAVDVNTPVREQYIRACLFRSGWSDEKS